MRSHGSQVIEAQRAEGLVQVQLEPGHLRRKRRGCGGVVGAASQEKGVVAAGPLSGGGPSRCQASRRR